ncbi:MAG TPA: DUF4836 family protein [Flavisolibacter sp.]|jgi:hypothetical protein|nr:DUF4836 family protein [Flavisolibacter sp.]
MKRNPLLIAVTAVIVVLASCKNGDNSGLAVPKDAAIVLHINTSSLSSKLSWKEIQQTNWFKEMHKESNDSLAQKLMDDPENSGIDTKKDLTFFMRKSGSASYTVFEGIVKDAAAFETFAKKTTHTSDVKKDKEWSFIQSESRNLLAWNKEKFAFITSTPEFSKTSFDDSDSNDYTSFSSDSLKKAAIDVLTLSSSNSLSSDDRFADLLKQDGDVHLWMNSGQLYSNLGGGMMSMMKVNTLFDGNVSASVLNFDDGKITMKSKQYYNDQMTALLKKYEAKPMGNEVINRIPSQNVIGAMVMNYPPESIKEFLRVTGFDGMVNGFLGKYNYSLDELMAAYKGQMVIAATDLTLKQETQTFEGTDYTHTSKVPDAKFLFALSVKDKASFDKLLGIATEQMKKEGQDSALSKFAWKTTNDWFAFSNNAGTVDQFLAGSSTKQPFADKISGHPFGMYIDIQKLMTAFKPMAAEPTSLSMLDASMKLWQDVVMTGGEFKDNAMTSEFVVNMVDKKTNSLKQLNQYFDQLAATQLANKKAMRDQMDSMQTMPMIDSMAAPK